jgi:hypothetical protein
LNCEFCWLWLGSALEYFREALFECIARRSWLDGWWVDLHCNIKLIGPSSDFLKILANNLKPIGVYGCDWNPIDNSFTSLKHCFYSINLKDRDTGMGTDDAHPYEKAYTSSLRTHH